MSNQTIRTRKRNYLWIILPCIALLLNACSKEEESSIIDPTPEKTEEPYIRLSDNTQNVRVDSLKGMAQFTIEANCKWSSSVNVDWMDVSPASGEGNATLTYRWEANTDTRERTGTVTVISDKAKRSFYVVQRGSRYSAPKLLSSRGVVGNRIKDEDSYFELTFDQPVTVESWEAERYQFDSKPSYSNNSKTVRQPFDAAEMGLELTCKVKVKSQKGLYATINFTIPFYQKKFTPEGEVRFTMLSEDRKSIWVTLTRPNKLLQLSLEDGQVMHDIDIPFAPNHICYNPYNQKLYVLPLNEIYDLGYDNQLCMIDPQKACIEETFTFDPSPDAHPQYPAIYPYDLQFTNDGLGIILLREKGASGLEWRYFDSADSHKQSLSGYSWADYWFEHLYRSADGQKLWANPYCQSYTPIYSVSRDNPIPKEYPIAGKFNSDKYYAGGNMMDMQFNSWNNKVFICTAPGSQCVIDLDTNTYSEVTEAESRFSKAAWDNSNSDRSWVYLVSSFSRYLLLLDMDHADCIYYNRHIWYDTPRNVYHLSATDQVMVAVTDGIYLFDASTMKKDYR